MNPGSKAETPVQPQLYRIKAEFWLEAPDIFQAAERLAKLFVAELPRELQWELVKADAVKKRRR